MDGRPAGMSHRAASEGLVHRTRPIRMEMQAIAIPSTPSARARATADSTRGAMVRDAVQVWRCTTEEFSRGGRSSAIPADARRGHPTVRFGRDFEGMARRYGELGVHEVWRLHGFRSSFEFQVDFLALGAGTEPRRIDASVVLEGLTPGDVCEAADGVRRSLTPEEAIEAVTGVMRRRQRVSVRVRDAEAAPIRSSSRPASSSA